MTAYGIGWVTRGTPKTEEQQEAGGNGTLRTLVARRTRGTERVHSRRKEPIWSPRHFKTCVEDIEWEDLD